MTYAPSPIRHLTLGAVSLAVFGCGGPDTPAGPVTPEPATLTAVSGTGQTGQVGEVLAEALGVRVDDASGHPVQGITVTFAAINESGTSEPAAANTDVDGIARTKWTLGTIAGEDTLRVISPSLPGAVVKFTATVAPGPVSPSRSSLSVSRERRLVGELVDIHVVARDDFDNPLEGLAVSLNASGAGHTIVQPAEPTASNGTASGRIESEEPGPTTVSAEVDGVTLDQTIAMTVSYGEGTLLGRTYCTIEGVSSLMDVYLPGDSHPRPLPVAVHVHGGGYTGGSRSAGFWFPDIAQTLLNRGYLVVSLDYRLAPAHKYPAQIQDAKCAIRRLRADADLYGLDPDRIGVWGSSAGAQLVGLMGTTGGHSMFDDVGGFQEESSEVQAVAALSAITDFTLTSELDDDYSAEFPTWPDPDSPELIEASPALHVSPDDSPFLFIAGEDDALVLPAQSQHMNTLLRDAGVSSDTILVAHADHGLMPTDGPISPGKTVLIGRLADFFDQHLR